MIPGKIVRTLFVSFAAFGILPASAIGAENLVLNSGMEEEGSETPGLARGWSVVYSSGGEHKLALDGDVKTQGAFSQRFENVEGGMKFPRVYQKVDVKPNTTYRFSADVRTNSRVQVWIAKKTWGRQFGSRGVPADDKWHTVNLGFNSGENEQVTVIVILLAPNRAAGT